MTTTFKILSLILITALLFACSKEQEVPKEEENMNDKYNIKERLAAYAFTEISADISTLTERQQLLVKKLIEAGKLTDEIFWAQTSHSSVKVRDELLASNNPEEKDLLEYVMINYGPYDAIFEDERFYGEGPENRPDGGAFYPIDITKEEFEKYVADNPDQKEELESQYTVVKRDGEKLVGVPYHVAYPQVMKIADLLDEAAELADNPSLKNYLTLRAKAMRADDYLESDMAWMDIKDNDIDIVIGPIENYEDGIFNYKTAYECVVMVKDAEASKELDMFNRHINDFEQRLPYDKKYINESVGSSNVLQVVNVAYFGGDCQKAVKTIAASLPNDPRVHETKGGKKSMYKNMMEAKFDKIVVPISKVMLDESLIPHVNKKAFTSFVTLHEVSHTLGPRYVYGEKEKSCRKALKERYSAIEETKADILGMYNHKHLLEMGEIDEEYMKKAKATYLAGMYRSIRFGAEQAHGRANLIQLNYLREQGAIVKQENGKYTINDEIFFEKVADLARIILLIEATGDYEGAGKIIEEYGHVTELIEQEIESLKDVPRDLNTRYVLK